jgi:hypothetical protein
LLVARSLAANDCEGFPDALVLLEGSAAQPAYRDLMKACRAPSTGVAADVPHLVASLHGSPALLDIVNRAAVMAEAAGWIVHACAAFTIERQFLTELIVAAGPPPSTPQEAQTLAAIRDARRVLSLLGGSERQGCALGAVIALLLDWPAIRSMLDVTARPLGVAVPPCLLPGSAEIEALLLRLSPDADLERKLTFGARQLLAQHRALWSIAQSRADARRHMDPPYRTDQSLASWTSAVPRRRS